MRPRISAYLKLSVTINVRHLDIDSEILVHIVIRFVAYNMATTHEEINMPKSARYSPFQIHIAQSLVDTATFLCKEKNIPDRSGSDSDKLDAMLCILKENNYLREHTVVKLEAFNLDVLLEKIFPLYNSRLHSEAKLGIYLLSPHMAYAQLRFADYDLVDCRLTLSHEIVSLDSCTTLNDDQYKQLGSLVAQSNIHAIRFNIVVDKTLSSFIEGFRCSGVNTNSNFDCLDLTAAELQQQKGIDALRYLIANFKIVYLNLNGLRSNAPNTLLEIFNALNIPQYIYLSKVNLTKDNAKTLANLIRGGKDLKAIDCSYNKMEEGLSDVCKAWQETESKFIYIKLGGEAISDSCMEELVKALKIQTELNALILADSQLSKNALGTLFASIGEEALQTLNLGKNNIEDADAGKLATFIASSQLEELNLAENKIGDIGVEKIKNSAPSSLQHLNLSKNQITSASTDVLITLSNRLVSLDLSGNKLDTETVKKIAENLKESTPLRSLNLSGNTIDEAAAIAWAAVIKNPQYQILSINLGRDLTSEAGLRVLDEAVIMRNEFYRQHIDVTYSVLRPSSSLNGYKALAEQEIAEPGLLKKAVETNNMKFYRSLMRGIIDNFDIPEKIKQLIHETFELMTPEQRKDVELLTTYIHHRQQGPVHSQIPFSSSSSKNNNFVRLDALIDAAIKNGDSISFEESLDKKLRLIKDAKKRREIIKKLIPLCKGKTREEAVAFRNVLYNAYAFIRQEDTRDFIGFLNFMSFCGLFTSSFQHLAKASKVQVANKCDLNEALSPEEEGIANQGLLGEITQIVSKVG